jgi:streptomycin 6-kinase
VMRRLREADMPEGFFPSVEDWSKGLLRLRARFDGGTGPFPKHLIEAAECLFLELLASMDESTLWHGDLHHWNILSAEREPWLAIDPKGVIGEPAYEVGAWLRNPFPSILEELHPERVIARRLDQFVEELGFDRDRMLGWGLVQSVLAAWWSFEEDDEGWRLWLKCATMFLELQ